MDKTAQETLQIAVAAVCFIAFCVAAGYGCSLEHQETMKRIELGCIAK